MNRNIVVTTHCVKCFLIAVRLCLLLELYECGSGLKSRDFSFVCETTQCRISKGFPHPHFYRNNTHTQSLENFPLKPKGVKGKYRAKKKKFFVLKISFGIVGTKGLNLVLLCNLK